MRLIGIGMHRTGTVSIWEALKKLGIGPVYHGFEFGGRPQDAGMWREAIDKGGDIDWNRIFGDYEVAMDWPLLGFWEQVTAFYPDAKVLLTVRDPETWFDSQAALVGAVFDSLSNGTHPATAEVNDVMNDVILGKFAPHGPLHRDHAIEVFERHYAMVRATIPPDRLLTYHVSEGWGPLCQLFGLDVPDEQFPRVNAREFAYENTKRALGRTAASADGMQWL